MVKCMLNRSCGRQEVTKMTRFRVLIWCWLLSFGIIAIPCSRIAAKASGPEMAMRQIISSLQTGTENWTRFSPQLIQVIAYQTNGTGVYYGLALLGVPTNVHMERVIPL